MSPGTWTLMALPRLLLFWLSDTVTELLHRASKPRIPPTQSPITHTCRAQTPASARTRPAAAGGERFTHLAAEGRPLQGAEEVAVHLVGSQDDGGHGVLVLRRRRSQQGQRSQRDVVLTAGQAALVVAVRAQAEDRTEL